MGTFSDCLPIVSAQQLGYGIREVRPYHPSKLCLSRTLTKLMIGHNVPRVQR